MSRGLKIAGGILIVAIASFGIYAGLGVRALMAICYNMVKYQLKNITSDAIYIDFTLKLSNPSFLSVDVNGYHLDVYLNNKFIANVTSADHATIASKGISTITIPLKVAYLKTFSAAVSRDLISNFANQRFEKIIVSLKGKLNGTVLKVPVNVPVDTKWTLKEIETIMNTPSEAPPCKT